MAGPCHLLLERTFGSESFQPCDTWVEAGETADARKGGWVFRSPTTDELTRAICIVCFNEKHELAGWVVRNQQQWAAASPDSPIPAPPAEESTLAPGCAVYIRPHIDGTRTLNAKKYELAEGRSLFTGEHKRQHREYLRSKLQGLQNPGQGYAVLLEGRDATLSQQLYDDGFLQQDGIIIPNPDPYVCHCIKRHLPHAHVYVCFLDALTRMLPDAAVGQCKLIWADYCSPIETYARKDIPLIFDRGLPCNNGVLAVTYNYRGAQYGELGSKKLPMAHMTVVFQTETSRFVLPYLARGIVMSPFPTRAGGPAADLIIEDIQKEEQGPYRGKSGKWNMCVKSSKSLGRAATSHPCIARAGSSRLSKSRCWTVSKSLRRCRTHSSSRGRRTNFSKRLSS